jgi:hypothetical protein
MPLPLLQNLRKAKKAKTAKEDELVGVMCRNLFRLALTTDGLATGYGHGRPQTQAEEGQEGSWWRGMVSLASE